MGTVDRFLDTLLTYEINVFPELYQSVLEVLFVSGAKALSYTS